MKINNQTLKPNYEIVVLPRSDSNDIIIKAEAVLDFSEFDALVPQPRPKVKTYPGGKKELATDAKDYRTSIADYGVKKTNFLYIKSISNTEGLEWEKVDFKNPETWGLFLEELKESGFTEAEISHILTAIHKANGLDEEHLTKARESFLLFERLRQEFESTQLDELETTSSGEPANG